MNEMSSTSLYCVPGVFRCGKHTVELEPTNGGFGYPRYWIVEPNPPFARIKQTEFVRLSNGKWGVYEDS